MISLTQRIIAIFLCCSTTIALRQCSVSDLRQPECFSNETCMANSNSSNEKIGYCQCKRGFQRVNESLCVQIQGNKNAQQPSTSSLVDDSNSNHLAVAILIPLFIISLVIIGVYIGHRYKLIAWIRTKMNQRKSNYDEVMIGQDLDDDDDPPLR